MFFSSVLINNSSISKLETNTGHILRKTHTHRSTNQLKGKLRSMCTNMRECRELCLKKGWRMRRVKPIHSNAQTHTYTQRGNDPAQMYIQTLLHANRCDNKTCLCVCVRSVCTCMHVSANVEYASHGHRKVFIV